MDGHNVSGAHLLPPAPAESPSRRLPFHTPHHQLFSLVSLCLPFPGTVFTPHSRPQHPDTLCSADRLPVRLCPPRRRHRGCNPSKHAPGSWVPDMLFHGILTSALRCTVTYTVWMKKLRHHNFQHFYRKSQRSKQKSQNPNLVWLGGLCSSLHEPCWPWIESLPPHRCSESACWVNWNKHPKLYLGNFNFMDCRLLCEGDADVMSLHPWGVEES